MKTDDKQAMNITYKAGQNPPLFITLLQGLSHLSLYPVALAFPFMLIQLANISVTDAVGLSQVTFLTMVIASILLALKPGVLLGSGYLCQSFFTAAIFAARFAGLFNLPIQIRRR
jgi:hypothetical protein